MHLNAVTSRTVENSHIIWNLFSLELELSLNVFLFDLPRLIQITAELRIQNLLLPS